MISSIIFSQELDSRYHSSQEINAYLDSLNNIESISNLMKIDTIGFSTQENLPILAIKISDKTLTYSFIANVKYANKTVDLVQNIPAEKLEKGTFYVNVFDNGQLVSNTTFTLR